MSIHERIRLILIDRMSTIHEQLAEHADEIYSERVMCGSDRPDADDKRFVAQCEAEMAQYERKLTLVERYLDQHQAEVDCGCRGVR